MHIKLYSKANKIVQKLIKNNKYYITYHVGRISDRLFSERQHKIMLKKIERGNRKPWIFYLALLDFEKLKKKYFES